MKVILDFSRHVGVGVSLIVIASAVLLLSDTRRGSRRDAARYEVAVFNYTSVTVLEDGEAGLIDGLAEEGLAEGRGLRIRRYNAEGDRPTAILIAKEVVTKDFDAILTLSTPVLQSVANANRARKRTHVFTLTTDPWGAGIGIEGRDGVVHPPYMTGYGTLQPVEAVFKLAREANPDLKRVGVVWNPAEANSESSTLAARDVCEKMDIELLEVTVDSSSGVAEAAKALVARDVEAIWAGGDSTVAMALDTVVAAAKDGDIPVFTNMPSDVKQGVLFALGADYYEVGRAAGKLAARVLRGADPAGIPVENYVPEQLALNTLALAPVKDRWRFGDGWRDRAALVVDEKGVHQAVVADRAKPDPGRTYEVGIVYFAPNSVTDATIAGLKKRLSERGFVEGKNVNYRPQHAQGDMATIPAIMQNMDQSDVDLLVVLTTPCLSSAAATVKDKPVVFTEVYDPIAAGAGKSFDDHLPLVTGVGSFPPLEKMIEVMREIRPGLKSIGVVYNNAEPNSRKAITVARQIVERLGLTLEEATANNASEVLPAAQTLVQRGVEVLWELGDNTANQGLEALIKAGRDADIPVVNSDAESCGRGAVAGVGISFADSGYAAGDLAARVLLGESPARIPFQEVAKVRLGANLEAAERIELVLPPSFLAQCEIFHGLGAARGRPARVAFVQLVDAPTLEGAATGVFEGLEACGLTDSDIETRTYNAQGETSRLPQIYQLAIQNGTDVIITSTTPAMIAAARATKDVPIVFTVASYPPAVNVYPEGQRPPNLVGVYDDPPIADLLALADRREGGIKVVGAIWNPGEPNSEISTLRLREACEQQGYELRERSAASTNELRDITSALCQSGVDILVISACNVTSTGFPAIYAVTSKQGVPIYCTEPDLVARGAEAAIGVDFYDWGRQTARLAAKVIAGVEPDDLPFEKLESIRTVTQDDLPKEGENE